MSVPTWQPGTTYAPGALVVPRSKPVTAVATLTNGDLTAAGGWTLPAPLTMGATGGYGGGGQIVLALASTTVESLNEAHIGPVVAGQTISAACMARHDGSNSHSSDVGIVIRWFNASDVQIGTGNSSSGLPSLSSSDWQQIKISAQAPAGVSYCRIGVGMHNDGTSTCGASHFSLSYTPQVVSQAAMYKATQAKPGKSGSTEPAWPPLGQSVQDNEVTWNGVNLDRLVWQASPLLESGDTEPTWPTTPGGAVHDGTIDWIASSPVITDPNCPHSTVVAIMASKVFAADKDIVRFCATANALDWTSQLDAGYLPTGLQQSNSNDMAVLAPYRGNLTAFNASCFQNWQVDPDPAAMALLDQMEGIGSTWQLAAHPVGNELFYLSQLGVRSVSIAAGADNLKAADVGTPVDSLLQAALAGLAAGAVPRAMYYPGAGQYWLAFPGDTTQAFVFTMNAGKGKWSRYTFPFSVDAFAQLDNDCYVRHGDYVSRIDESAVTDDVPDVSRTAVGTNFDGVVQWGWLDCGPQGQTKMLQGFDIVASGNPSVSIGYDQTNTSRFTAPYAITPDTVPGTIVPLPVSAPSFSPKVTFPGGQKWSVLTMSLYLDGTTGQP